MRSAGVLAAFLLLAMPALAEERISNFSSDVDVAQSGVLTVKETITVEAEGERIQHGIFRVIPTDYHSKLGRRVHVRLDIVSVTRDGESEPYTVEGVEDGKQIKIGDKDRLVAPGEHVYVVTYQTNRQIGFFSDYDELYWNVTGNQWQFPIDRAETTIHLPESARIKQYAFYTGPTGSNARDAAADKPSDRELHVVTTAPLQTGWGLTVAVGFSKGAVMPPDEGELRLEFLRDNAAAAAALGGIAVLLAYFVIAWWLVGRDPKRGVVIALFAPPNGFSPAAVRFVRRMSYDRKAYSASLVDMAVKGYLKISEADRTYTLTRTDKSAKETALSHGEIAIADKLFRSGATLELKQENHTDVAASISALKASLAHEYERVYFVTNSGWFTGGLAILALTAIAAALYCDDVGAAVGILFWLAGWSLGTAFLWHRAYDAWMAVVAGPGSRFLNFFGALFMTGFALPFTIGLFVGIFGLTQAIAPAATFALVLGGVASYVFYHLLKAPTLAGAKILDEIEGLRLFLNTAEKDRLEALNPPEVTPEVFERFLPYAIALDCENQWSKRFEAEAAAAGRVADRGTSYTPLWYSGASFDRLGAAGFTTALGASMASAAASAATTPGSSSGSGGGGFSGGGGGGGGGGGW